MKHLLLRSRNGCLRRNKIKTIVTIGDGVAAWCLHHELRKVSDIKIINISANDYFSPCSLKTTSINCLRGTEENVSPLGDLIRQSWFTFLEVHKEKQFNSVAPATEYQILEEKTVEKWERRYPQFETLKNHSFLSTVIKNKSLYHAEQAYFVDPYALKLELEAETSLERINDLVTQILKINNGYEIKMHAGSLLADKIILCTNHMTPQLVKHTTSEFKKYLAHSKPVSGSYLELKNANSFGFKFDTSFNLAIEKYHFIYRKEENKVHIGSNSENQSSREFPHRADLKKIYDHIDKFTQFELPEFQHFEQLLGIRYKGYKRLPFWGKIDHSDMFAICGLYKNAFTFAFQGARDLARDLSL